MLHGKGYVPGKVLVRSNKGVVPMEITFMDNGGNTFMLYEFIDYMNS
jgi:hypothetical protein